MSAPSARPRKKHAPNREEAEAQPPQPAASAPEVDLPLLREAHRPLAATPGFWLMIAILLSISWFVGDFLVLTQTEAREMLLRTPWCSGDAATAVGERTTYVFRADGTFVVDVSAGDNGSLFTGSGRWDRENLRGGVGAFLSHPQGIAGFAVHRADFLSIGESGNTEQYKRLRRCKAE